MLDEAPATKIDSRQIAIFESSNTGDKIARFKVIKTAKINTSEI